MIFPTPSFAALTAALFVSSVASRPTAENNQSFKCKQKTEDGLVSIKYPSGEVRPLVDNIWYEGVECVKQDFNEALPHECLYRKICYSSIGSEILISCPASPETLKKTVYERKELTPICAKDLICQRNEKPPQQSKEDQERERAKQPKVKVPFCEKTFQGLLPISKRCIYERAIQLGRNNTLYAEQYHDSIESCDEYFDIINKYPEQCVLEYTEKLDERFPPPAEEHELLKDKECGELNFGYKDYGNCLEDYVNYLNTRRAWDRFDAAGYCSYIINRYKKSPDKCARLLVEYTKKHSPDAKKDRYKNQKAKDGKPCSEFSGATSIEEIPEECLRPVFCNANYPRSKQGCPPANFRSGDVNKEELMKKVKSTDCAQPALCNYEDLYNLPE